MFRGNSKLYLLKLCLFAVTAGFALAAKPAAAVGETYTWKDKTQIQGSGGEFIKPHTFSYNEAVNASEAEGEVSVRTLNCSYAAKIINPKSGSPVIRTTADDQEYSNSLYGDPNGPAPRACKFSEVQSKFNGPITIGNGEAANSNPTTKPGDDPRCSNPGSLPPGSVLQCDGKQQIVGCASPATLPPYTEGQKVKCNEGVNSEVTISFPKGADDPDNCEAGAITFFICDMIIDPMNAVISWVFDKLIISLLKFRPLQNDGGLYNAWKAVRNLTLGFFFIIFLVSVFATALGVPIDNYTLKKVMPRMVLAAIFIPFSWVICAIIIDIGNIFGAGIGSVFNGVTAGIEVDLSTGLLTGVGGFGAAVGAIVGAYAVLATPGAAVALAFSLFSLVLAVLTVFLTLVLRHLVISALLVLSPVAFIAWILPATEGFFKKWLSFLTKAVLMYPLIVLLINMAFLLQSLGTTGSGTFEAGVAEPVGQLVSIMLPAIALFLIPATFKVAGGAIAAVSGFAAGKTAAAKNKFDASETRKRAREDYARGKAGMAAGMGGRTVFGKPIGTGKVGKGFGRVATGAVIRGAGTQRTIQGNMMKAVKEIADVYDKNDLTPDVLQAIATPDMKAKYTMQDGTEKEMTGKEYLNDFNASGEKGRLGRQYSGTAIGQQAAAMRLFDQGMPAARKVAEHDPRRFMRWNGTGDSFQKFVDLRGATVDAATNTIKHNPQQMETAVTSMRTGDLAGVLNSPTITSLASHDAIRHINENDIAQFADPNSRNAGSAGARDLVIRLARLQAAGGAKDYAAPTTPGGNRIESLESVVGQDLFTTDQMDQLRSKGLI